MLDLSIKDLFTEVNDILLFILALKGPPLLMATLIAVGYGFRLYPRFPNRSIPLMVVVLGVLLSPLLLPWPDRGELHPGLRWPAPAAAAQVLMQGFLVGIAAWLFHLKILKKLEEKIVASHSKSHGQSSPQPEPKVDS